MTLRSLTSRRVAVCSEEAAQLLLLLDGLAVQAHRLQTAGKASLFAPQQSFALLGVVQQQTAAEHSDLLCKSLVMPSNKLLAAAYFGYIPAAQGLLGYDTAAQRAAVNLE